MTEEPQVRASDPAATVFAAANAGAGKTSTLVKRVARLLLAGAGPQTILCVTYTKAAAAEMQRRLFEDLGDWAVMPDALLTEALTRIGEGGRDISAARALFARALETPGGLKIQTIHAFCEKLLRRFPLEAGISPGFKVLEASASAQISKIARDALAGNALSHPEGPIGAAYAYFSVALDFESFNGLFGVFEARREAIEAYLDRMGGAHALRKDVYQQCGFARPVTPADLAAEAMGRIRWAGWRRAADALVSTGLSSDAKTAAAMRAVTETSAFSEVIPIFLTLKGELRKSMGGKGLEAAARNWLMEEQARVGAVHQTLLAATIAQDTVHALTLATAYIRTYSQAKAQIGAMDFTDLIIGAHRLLTEKSDAAWVLYKLDSGLEHVLLDEAQDTAPRQWAILSALTAEFFTGQGAAEAPRSVFAVGDEKQSIFSFQGAAPERLATEARAFGARVAKVGGRFADVQLKESWRSTPEVLSFVDAVFLAPDLLAGLRPGDSDKVKGFPIEHLPRRPPGGCVDLWPIEVGEDREETDPWAPVDAEPPQSAARRLADRLAKAIIAMVAGREAVVDRETGKPRPMGFGDVLILVRRRGTLFHEIIRALKREGAPVGGADRLLLSDHGVFQDLVALGRFVCFPEDDLTLAALLRSPFCDVDETDLFDLAIARTDNSLWSVLTRRGGERQTWSEAAGFLTWSRGAAAGVTPFDFYSRVLARLDAAGRSMRQRILTRLGAEAQDALDAFLAQVLVEEADAGRDMETFLARMAAIRLDIKREAEAAGEEVRVMTVHGAKGLEAPVVILPDTTTRVTARSGPLLDTESGGFLWAPRSDEDIPASRAAREARQAAAEAESARLLYVALTRARDRLILCGVEAQAASFERSWYDWLQRAFEGLEYQPGPMTGGGERLRYGPDPITAEAVVALAGENAAMPDWLNRPAPIELEALRRRSPSRMSDTDEGPAPSPLHSAAGLGRYRRGEIIHRLLQLLPDVSPDERGRAAQDLAGREQGLSPAQVSEMTGAALAVLNDARFAAVFAPGSRPEVALAGVVGGVPVSGRVDRLVVQPGRVLVVDFKTNRPAPATITRADKGYILQMATYVALLRQVFPDRTVEAALVWTDGPQLMAVPDALMTEALQSL